MVVCASSPMLYQEILFRSEVLFAFLSHFSPKLIKRPLPSK